MYVENAQERLPTTQNPCKLCASMFQDESAINRST